MTELLDLPLGQHPDPDAVVRAAMRWHFDPATGSPFWLAQAERLDFDPLTDVAGLADLFRFPSVAAELRDVPVRDLVPRGYPAHPGTFSIHESGGTTGAPKRVLLSRDWLDRLVAWMSDRLDGHGLPDGLDWLLLVPGGPHGIAEVMATIAAQRGGLRHTVDLDPRWVKRLAAQGRGEEVTGYVRHVVEQAAYALRTQPIGILLSTPPLLEQLATDDHLCALVRRKVRAIVWAGAGLDPDTYDALRTDVFPDATFVGIYGNTMMLAGVPQQPGPDERPVFAPPAPWITFAVADPDTGRPVPYGERGQVVVHHLSRSFLLPNVAERDLAERVPHAVGDALADIRPLAVADDTPVHEGIY